jgi:hypothetical protein
VPTKAHSFAHSCFSSSSFFVLTEHQQFFMDQGTHNAYISQPVIDKGVWDKVQDFNPKTLSCSFVIKGKQGSNTVTDCFSTVKDIMGSGEGCAPLLVKIRAWPGAMELAMDTISHSPVECESLAGLL